LSRSSLEFAGDSVEFVLAECAGVGASFGEVLGQKPVGVLVAAALPRAAGIAEGDRDAPGNAESSMLSRLLALVPGDGSTQLFGQPDDGLGERVSDSVGGVAVG
jgi:hypothetical protein